MIKPTKTFPLHPMLDYDTVMTYLIEKYGIDDEPLYNWINRWDNQEETYFHLNVIDDMDDQKIPEPVRTTLKLMFDEFKDDLDKTGCLEFWIS